jgi:hypothetical protein
MDMKTGRCLTTDTPEITARDRRYRKVRLSNLIMVGPKASASAGGMAAICSAGLASAPATVLVSITDRSRPAIRRRSAGVWAFVVILLAVLTQRPPRPSGRTWRENEARQTVERDGPIWAYAAMPLVVYSLFICLAGFYTGAGSNSRLARHVK